MNQDYSTFLRAFKLLNDSLFDGKLDEPFITFTRKKGKLGYFWNSSYRTRSGKLGQHEISMNPSHFVGRSDKEIYSTFAHEIVHLWQQMFGKPGTNGYHNKGWAAKMVEIGLTPIFYDKTRTRVGHSIVSGGLFEQVIDKFLQDPKNYILLESSVTDWNYTYRNKAHTRGNMYTCGCTDVRMKKNMIFSATCNLCGNVFKPK